MARRLLLERLEPRVVLNAAPVTLPDPLYATDQDTALSVTSQDTTLLDNDWDPEGSTLSATLVAQAQHGTVSSFGSDGTFTYTPNTGYAGIDQFTYQASDGSVTGPTVSVEIAVGGDLGPRTNADPLGPGSPLADGVLRLEEPLSGSLSLQFNSATIVDPIISVDTSLLATASTPDSIDAQLTFGTTSGSTYGFDTTSLVPGQSLRVGVAADGSALATGRYSYDLKVSTVHGSTSTDHDFSGHYLLVRRNGSSQVFGKGWQLTGSDSLEVNQTGGILWVRDDGSSWWLADDGSGHGVGLHQRWRPRLSQECRR